MPDSVKLLYVDDDDDISSIVELAFEGDDRFHLTVCHSGQEALIAAEQAPPDMVLLDVMMPGMDGPTTLQQLQTQYDLTKVPVVFMTAKVQSSEVESYKALGAADVVAKPFDPMTLSNQIRQIWLDFHN